jgi:hypothetical protein
MRQNRRNQSEANSLRVHKPDICDVFHEKTENSLKKPPPQLTPEDKVWYNIGKYQTKGQYYVYTKKAAGAAVPGGKF